MSSLKKIDVYNYIKELLASESTVVKDIEKYESLLGDDEFDLPNVEVLDERLIIHNFTELVKQLTSEIDQLDYEYQSSIKRIDKLGSDNALSSEAIELNSRLPHIVSEIKLKQETINKMQLLYKRTHNLTKRSGLDLGKEVVIIEQLLTSEKLEINRELVSRSVDIKLNETDYSIEISPQDTVTLELDAFDISKLDMHSELNKLAKDIKPHNLTTSAEKALELLLISHPDITCDQTYKRIVIRTQSLKPTIEDYLDITEQISPYDLLDDTTMFSSSNENLAVDENELYLSLPANEEQRLIAWKLNHGSVAVQGPPGTGKTHTIVNIISHMLAKGKSVLVVSENKEALQVVHGKMPDSLKPLVIPMLGGAVDTRAHTEASIKHIVTKTDSLNVVLEEKKIDNLKAQRKQLQTELNTYIQKQLDTYVIENQDLEIYGESRKLAEWIKSIDLDKVCLGDCLTPEIAVDKHDIQQLLSYDQSLLLKVVKEYISSKYLLTDEEMITIVDLLKFGRGLSVETISNFPDNINFDLPVLNLPMLERIFNHWYLNPEEYALDLQDVTKLVEYEKGKTKFDRILFDNTVTIPSEIIDDQLLVQISKMKKSNVSRFFGKFGNNNLKKIKVNNQSLWQNLDNMKIVEAYLEKQMYLDFINRVTDRFNHHLDADLSVHDISSIIEAYQSIQAIDKILLENGIDFFKEEFKNNDFALLPAFINIPKATAAAKEYVRLKAQIQENISDHDMLYIKFDNIDNAIIEDEFTIDMYKQFCIEVRERENQYAVSNEIIEIKSRLDKFSPSLYSKLIDGSTDDTIIDNWRDNYIFTKVNEISKFEYKEKIETLKQHLTKVNIDLVETMAWTELLKKLGPVEKEAMQTLVTLMNKIGKGTGKNAITYILQAQAQIDLIKNKIPVWITTRKQVPSLFKYDNSQKFDLVIFDESSQSSIMALNVLERGKQKLIVGDDKQISPTSFINIERASRLRQKYFDDNEHILISHDTTLFDYASAKYGVVRLREHFRCLPEIIKFSNDLQYNGSMIPLRSINSRDKLEPVVESVFIEDGVISENETNIPEANAIVERIAKYVTEPKYQGKSIGVITLLSKNGKQEQLINDLLYNRLGTDIINQFNIKVANSNSFQGDERDVILLSLVTARKEGDDKLRTTALTKQMYYQRFNVAASRARDKIVLFHSITNSDITNKECVRFKILEFFENYQSTQERTLGGNYSFESQFQMEIYEYLHNKGFDVLPRYQSNGFEIDLVVEAREGKFAIECDGENFSTRDQFEIDFQRQAILERAGWNFYRMRARDYFSNKQQTLADLEQFMQDNNLTPYDLKS